MIGQVSGPYDRDVRRQISAVEARMAHIETKPSGLRHAQVCITDASNRPVGEASANL